VAAGEILAIVVLDYVVAGDGRYFSFREAGRLQACRGPPASN
jgi:DNA repair protein RadC